MGTTQVMTDVNGNVRWRATYEVCGKLESEAVWEAENNVRFPGQYHDRSTGLHYNMFRHYRPDLGRYLTPDPIGLAGGINLYGYAGQNGVWLQKLHIQAPNRRTIQEPQDARVSQKGSERDGSPPTCASDQPPRDQEKQCKDGPDKSGGNHTGPPDIQTERTE